MFCHEDIARGQVSFKTLKVLEQSLLIKSFQSREQVNFSSLSFQCDFCYLAGDINKFVLDSLQFAFEFLIQIWIPSC